MTGLAVSVAAHDGSGIPCTVVRLTGEADVTTPALREALGAEAAKRPPLLLVEVSRLTFMDSSAMNAIIQAHKSLRAAGCRLALVGPSGSVARILQLSGADQVIPVYASTDEALAATAAEPDAV